MENSISELKKNFVCLLLGAFRDNFPGFACWGDFILRKSQNQFCAYSEHPGQNMKQGCYSTPIFL